MKHGARDGLIALLAVAALALVGQRRATAGGCKADGAVCRTSRSCCGTSGNNGVCVEESGAKFGVCCTPDCTGKECGDDGCGGSCGTCTAPQTCGGGGTVNVCGCTPRTTCPAGDNCGSVPDGCGGTLDCGACTAPETCGGGGTPNVCGSGCIPTGQGASCDPSSSVCCPVPNGSVFCGGNPTTCRLSLCNPGFANCNNEAADGCEVNLNTDSSNCGSCGHICPAGTSCVMGSCQ